MACQPWRPPLAYHPRDHPSRGHACRSSPAAASACFSTVNEFGIVFFIGAKGVITLPLLIYDKAIQEFDYTTACVIAVVNVALSLMLYALYRTVLGRVGGARAGLG